MVTENEIINVVNLYVRSVDTRQWQAFRSLVDLDIIFRYHDLMECHGIEAFENLIRSGTEPLDATQHLLSNFIVNVREDQATVSTYLQAVHVRASADGDPLYTVAGMYDLELSHGEDDWKIKAITFKKTWTSGNEHVMDVSQ